MVLVYLLGFLCITEDRTYSRLNRDFTVAAQWRNLPRFHSYTFELLIHYSTIKFLVK